MGKPAQFMCRLRATPGILYSEPGGVKGDTLIDIDSGPTVHQLLSACESFKEIILEAFDWTPVVKYVCELEGNRYRGWKKRLRKSNPLDPIVLPPADGLVSSLCLEAACKDLTTYRIALKNISSLLKHLVLSGDLSCSFYMVGPKRFSCLVLKEEFLREALSETGFIIQEFEVLVRDDNIDDSSDFSGKVFILARKEEAI
uniref:Uncharacterized protein n=1 Tax=Chrysemys picta bellii TaxID=8478 RepID=A0A8C3P8Q5_CHRPI